MSRRLLAPAFAAVAALVIASPIGRAQGPIAPAIYDIGDLPGGAVTSVALDATRVSGVIYAAAASAVNSTDGFGRDTPALWTSNGAGGGTLEALPEIGGVSNANTFSRFAHAITPDGAFIASQALHTTGSSATRWVRVDRSLLSSPDPTTANLDIFTVFGGPFAAAAYALSDDGSVVYGLGGGPAAGTQTPRRFESGLGINFVDMSATGKTWGVPTPRGTSADGSIMVGIASDGAIMGSTSSILPPYGYPVHSVNTMAFRYVHTANTLTGTTTAIPFLANGGTWNFPIATSSDGAVTVVAGNSDDFPNGEIYLTDASNTITAALGSPNMGLTPRPLGGRTADGAIVVTFHANSFEQAGGIPFFNRISYAYNDNGWFLLGSILRAQGIDLELLGWDLTSMVVTSVRTADGADLITGQGNKGTFDPMTGGIASPLRKGFVIQLPAGALASFDEPTDPVDDTLTGAWASAPVAPATFAGLIPVYLGNGRYVTFTQGSGNYQNGVERGRYVWPGNGGTYDQTARSDTNALFGLQLFSVALGRTLTITNDAYRIANTRCNPASTALGCTGRDTLRVVGAPDTIVGAWHGTVPSGPFAGTAVTAVFMDASHAFRYLVDYDVSNGPDDFELGTYTYDGGADMLTVMRDTSSTPDVASATLSRDGLALDVVTDEGVMFALTRVVPRSSVVPVLATPLAASATFGQPFTLTIPATYTLTFSSNTLPGGLSLDANTGVIFGTPTTTGTYVITVTGSNTFGDSAQAELTLTIATATTSTTLASSPNPSSPGQTVNFVATVAGQYGGLVTGTVAFTKGQQTLGTAAVQPDGTATLPLSTLGTGSTVVTATYGGDANNTASASPSVTQDVVAPSASTTTTLASSQNPSIVGQSVTLTATVTSATAGTIGGTVDFRRGQTVLFTGSVVNGQASYTTTTLPLGSSGLTAVYSGDAQYITSTSTSLTQIVNLATTTTSLVSSPNPSDGGSLVTLTATIASNVPGAITGTVTFRRGSTVLGIGSLSGNQASLAIATLPGGSSNLTAIYSGDATHAGSTSASITHVVNTGTTTTTLISSLNPSTAGTPVTFTATVVSSLGTTPTGTVQFVEGGTTLGSAPLVDGTATVTISTLSLKSGKTDTHNIKAKYLGDAYNGNSTSATLAQVVNP
jgi:hypothetical protein